MKPVNFILLFVICLAVSGQLAGVIYLPSLPTMTTHFNSNESSIKLVLLLYLLGFGCSQLFFGTYSDQKGRKKALLIGLSFSVIGNMLCTVTDSLFLFNASRILVGLGSGGAACVGRAVLRDMFQDKKMLIRATSIIGTVTALTPAVGPVIGGFVQQFLGWRYNFIILTVYVFAILLVCIILFYETNQNRIEPANPLSIIKEFGVIIKNSSFSIYVLCAAISFSGLIAYEISAPFLFEDIIGLTPSQFGIVSFFIAGSISIGSFLNSKFSSNFTGYQRVKLVSLLFMMAAILLFVFYLTISLSILSIFIPVMFFVMGVGILFPTAIANALLPFTKNVGSASALFGFTQMTMTMLVNFGFSLIKVNSVMPLAISFLVCGASIFLLTTKMKPDLQVA